MSFYMLLFKCWILQCLCAFVVFFFKQKTAYEMRISDWSSDVCSSDLWLLAHIFFLIGFRNRLAVMLDWTWSYWSYQRAARIILGRGHDDRRSGERRVGKECVSTCRSRGSPEN